MCIRRHSDTNLIYSSFKLTDKATGRNNTA
jgi:hypothetical protein